MRITALSGGIGGARFLRGMLAILDPSDEVTVITNTADDIWLFGLRICPDLDTVMYTLGGAIDPERGWGRANETWRIRDELQAYGVQPDWFGLGDVDVATHLVRTQMLNAGFPLSQVTQALCQRWNLGSAPTVRLLPMSDDRVETHIVVDDEAGGGRHAIHFQEYWVRLRASVPVRGVTAVGIQEAHAAPGVVDAIEDADLVLLPPSNPIVSIGTIVGVQEIRAALRATRAPIVGLSPIVDGGAVRGMADQLLTGLGISISAAAVATHYGARASDGLLDGWLIDQRDAAQVGAVEAAGIRCRAVPLMMDDEPATQQMAREALGLATALVTDGAHSS